MNRKNYSVSELVDSPSFRRMVYGIADQSEINQWNDWIEANNENRIKAKKAVSEITGFEFKAPELPDIKKEWSRLSAKTVGSKNKRNRYTSKKGNYTSIYLAAAVILLASLLSLWMYSASRTNSGNQLDQISQTKTITTGESELKSLKFSNGSKIVLNSNSSLTYSIGLKRESTIDVTLDGEAYFDAESKPFQENPVFSVNTPDGVIKDIGTEFLVTVQQGKSRVVLQEGRVEVEYVKQVKSKNPDFYIEKGEVVEFNRTNILRREMINPTFYTSWATEYIELDKTTLREFAGYVEQRFGVEVEIEDSVTANITLDGAVYFKSLEDLIRSVSEVTGKPMYQSELGDTVHIGR